MAERKEYLEQLKAWKDEQVIKVVTGIRRCGKSTLLSQYQQQLKTTGITDEQIVSVNFEVLEYEELLDYRKLYSYLKERLCAEKTTYKNLPCVGRRRGQRENTMGVFVKKALSAECGRSRRRLCGRFGLDAIAARFFEAGKG